MHITKKFLSHGEQWTQWNTKEPDVLSHSKHGVRLSRAEYEIHHSMLLPDSLKEQYMVEDSDLKHLLLSPRAGRKDDSYMCCSSCKTSLHLLQESIEKKSIPSKTCAPPWKSWERRKLSSEIWWHSLYHPTTHESSICCERKQLLQRTSTSWWLGVSLYPPFTFVLLCSQFFFSHAWEFFSSFHFCSFLFSCTSIEFTVLHNLKKF